MTRARDLAAFVSNADGDIKFDTDTLFIDSSANRVGIGLTDPANSLSVKGGAHQLDVETSATGVTFESIDRAALTDSSDIAYYARHGVHQFFTGSYTERMRIKDDGDVGINNTSPNTKLDIIGSSTNGSGIVDTLRLRNTGTTANDGARIQFTAGTSTSGAGIGSGGQALNSADLRFYAGGNTERMRVLHGGGLTFNGDTAAANALDDYEEGTWTPQLDSGVGTPSYAQQHGTYTKIGRQVMAFFYLELNGGTPTGDNLRVINLPFTNVNDSKSYQVTSGYVNSSAGFGTTFTFILFPNETRLRAYQQTTTSVSQLTGSNLGNAFSFLGRVLYFV